MKCVFVFLLLSGCALLSKSEPLPLRYFTPERASVATTASASGAATLKELRLGRVSAGSEIRQNLVYRASDFELGFDEESRWTEKPETYLRRALSRVLFEDHKFRRVVSGPARTLDAELAAFEEQLGEPSKVRVSVVVSVVDDRTVLLERTLTIEGVVTGPGRGEEGHADAVVGALSAALSQMVQRIADELANQGEINTTSAR